MANPEEPWWVVIERLGLPMTDFRFRIESEFLTPFEHRMVGGSPPQYEIIMQRGGGIGDYHIPDAVLTGEASIEDANRIRQALGFITRKAFSLHLKYPESLGDINIPLEPLDPKTGETIGDPRLPKIGDRDLTKEYYDMLREWNNNHPEGNYYSDRYPIREGAQSALEEEASSPPEEKG